MQPLDSEPLIQLVVTVSSVLILARAPPLLPYSIVMGSIVHDFAGAQ